MSPHSYLAMLASFVLGVTLTAGATILWTQEHPPIFWLSTPPTYSFLYYSITNAEPNISVSMDGTVEIGKHYDRETEARKLAELAYRFANTYREEWNHPECRQADYSVLEYGMKRIYPGTANPPPPITEQWN